MVIFLRPLTELCFSVFKHFWILYVAEKFISFPVVYIWNVISNILTFSGFPSFSVMLSLILGCPGSHMASASAALALLSRLHTYQSCRLWSDINLSNYTKLTGKMAIHGSSPLLYPLIILSCRASAAEKKAKRSHRTAAPNILENWREKSLPPSILVLSQFLVYFMSIWYKTAKRISYWLVTLSKSIFQECGSVTHDNRPQRAHYTNSNSNVTGKPKIRPIHHSSPLWTSMDHRLIPKQQPIKWPYKLWSTFHSLTVEILDLLACSPILKRTHCDPPLPPKILFLHSCC